MYKPFKEQIASLNLPSTLSPLLGPKPGFLGIWPDKNEDTPLVETKYGLFHGGLSSPISSNNQVIETLTTLPIQCQILTC